MTSIDKTTISIGKAVTVMVFIASTIVSGLVAYYSAINGVKQGFHEISLEIKDLQGENNLQNVLISGNTKNIEFNYSLIKDLQEAIKPEEIEIKYNK